VFSLQPSAEVIMKISVFIVGALCIGISACASPNKGNPDGAAYAGTSGSVYDVAANPPRTAGTVGYDPYAPLPATMPAMGTSGAAMPPPMPSSGAMSSPR
jgi:hypothetical protein